MDTITSSGTNDTHDDETPVCGVHDQEHRPPNTQNFRERFDLTVGEVLIEDRHDEKRDWFWKAVDGEGRANVGSTPAEAVLGYIEERITEDAEDTEQ